MLDEVIEYLKQLQAQVHMMSRMNMPAMMLPMAMQQQLQMSMMSPMGMAGMGMGMGMGMNMDMNTIGRTNIPAGISPVIHPAAAFMPMTTSWDGSGDRLPGTPATVITDPMSAFLACQSQVQAHTLSLEHTRN